MSIIYQKNSKTGTVYAYENKAYWDKEKKQSRAKRTLIGKVDPLTGEIVPTRKYEKQEVSVEIKPKSDTITVSDFKRSFYGASYLFDQIGELTGVKADLKACFPNDYKKILSLGYFLIMEDNNSLSRFPYWQKLHTHPYKKEISSQRSSELLQSIDEESRINFFRKQGKRRSENEYWAFDTTSISSYSETLKQVKMGRNKEYDRLPQINLALLFGEKSGLPFYYRKLPGNISDVKTIKQLLTEFKMMNYKKVKVLFDRGFYSSDNISSMYKAHQKFIIGVKLNLKFVKEKLNDEKENLKKWSNHNSQFGVNGVCSTTRWEYEYKRPNKRDTIKEKRRAYLLLFYDAERAMKEQVELNKYLTTLHDELINNNLKEYHTNDYKRYFEVVETPIRGKKIKVKDEAVLKSREDHGYFALLSNEIKDPFEALSLYRSKDIVEKGFNNLKDRLNLRRMQVSSELSLNGKLFVEFIALIYLSYVKKKMQDAGLFKKWTLQGLLEELELIELLEVPKFGKVLGEVSKKQADIYTALGIKTPSL